jgi:hypothetical protein
MIHGYIGAFYIGTSERNSKIKIDLILVRLKHACNKTIEKIWMQDLHTYGAY